MTLNFMQKFPDGTDTFFKEKIWAGLLSNPQYKDHIESEFWEEFEYVRTARRIATNPKLHTFRRGNRWQQGKKIHFKVWSGTPYKSKTINFAPRINCTGQQKIFIQSPTLCLKSRIFIDGKQLGDDKINQLAINDGFNDEKHMFTYFKEHFEGQIVHWTSIRYQ